MYKINADIVTGKGRKSFVKGDIVSADDLLNVDDLVQNESITEISETEAKPKKVK